MLRYDYEITYKKGKGNVVVVELSRKYEDKEPYFPYLFPVQEWLPHDSTAQLIKTKRIPTIPRVTLGRKIP